MLINVFLRLDLTASIIASEMIWRIKNNMIFKNQITKSLNREPYFKQRLSLSDRVLKRQRMELVYPLQHFCYLVVQCVNKLINNKEYAIMAVSSDLNLVLFVEFIRKKMVRVANKSGIYIQINGKIVDFAERISLLYDKYREVDGFLYMRITTEDSF